MTNKVKVRNLNLWLWRSNCKVETNNTLTLKKLYPLLIILFLISPKVWGQKYSKRVLQLIADYHHAGPVSENGLIMVCKKDTEHCGCIDTMGNEVIPFKYGMNFSISKTKSLNLIV